MLKELIGKTVKKIYFNENYLKFETDSGNFVYGVRGDCCSTSYFYDFYGVKNLLNNGKIISIKEVELNPTDIEIGGNIKKDKKLSDDDIKVYGYQLTTENEKFGEMTSVFSFRNYSNGYYGGYMEESNDKEVSPEIFDDVIETVKG